jgi:hypothetical protein
MGKEDLTDGDKEALIDSFFESLHAIIMHYGLWFRETEHQLGLDKASEIDDIVWEKLLPTVVKRIAKRRVKLTDGIPSIIEDMSREDLIGLLEDMGKSWLADDGIWFQAIESKYGMNTAKRTNDTCWVRFSYMEAKKIAKMLGLPKNGGIGALKKALKFRQYARVNAQEIIDIGEDKIIFRMNDCRVQSARKRRGLPDYPCKSAGLVEYSRFAEGIDPRIKTRCIACPPDPHPEEWWCAWEFELSE